MAASIEKKNDRSQLLSAKGGILTLRDDRILACAPIPKESQVLASGAAKKLQLRPLLPKENMVPYPGVNTLVRCKVIARVSEVWGVLSVSLSLSLFA